MFLLRLARFLAAGRRGHGLVLIYPVVPAVLSGTTTDIHGISTRSASSPIARAGSVGSADGRFSTLGKPTSPHRRQSPLFDSGSRQNQVPRRPGVQRGNRARRDVHAEHNRHTVPHLRREPPTSGLDDLRYVHGKNDQAADTEHAPRNSGPRWRPPRLLRPRSSSRIRAFQVAGGGQRMAFAYRR